MGILTDFNAWEAKVKNAIPDVLMKEVKTVVERDFLSVARSDVYGAYSPILYERRFSAGGIYDLNMIYSRLMGKFTLVMEDMAPANSYNTHGLNAIEWVESGRNPPFARPFYAPLEVKAIPHAQDALISGLHKRGL